ncbi:MAG: aconitate hydratase [Coriobacteriales bacterium]|nr:aconitate hydratase [Coriobacteriales bacterium]
MSTLAYKILQDHLLAGELVAGNRVKIRIDQTLTQDSTGTMVYLQLEAMDIGQVATELSVAYIDHNTLQTGFENADDHAFIQSVAARHGIIFSKAGGGICHQLHLENYGKPGRSLLGSDSHTPTGGGLGMLAIGAGGLDVAIAMAQGEYWLTVPQVLGVRLTGSLRPWVSAKDIILELLRRKSVSGGVGYIVEYFGPGVSTLSVTERATITNMGAELGATTSIFPSDQNTLDYLTSQDRGEDWLPLSADRNAVYDAVVEIDLDNLVPLAAAPHSPDNVVAVSALGSIKVDQVAIGSCTNSSYSDLMKVATILKGRQIHPQVSLVIAPGSAAILAELAANGALRDIIAAGARVIECACGTCIGMGQSPSSGAVSLRSFNRNFKGRSGTDDADVYLVSPETAAISAITGYLTDGLATAADLGIRLGDLPDPVTRGADTYAAFVVMPPELIFSDQLPPLSMGPNIKPFPRGQAVPVGDSITGRVVLMTGDNITTDDIMPSDSRLLPYRSNIPHLSEFCYEKIDPSFPARAKAVRDSPIGGGVIIGGENYGQGSSREHAALAPLYLGIRMVLATSFARIHRANLINNGILPLMFAEKADKDSIMLDDDLVFEDAHAQLLAINPHTPGSRQADASLLVKNLTKHNEYRLIHDLSEEECQVILAGGRINAIKSTVPPVA